MEYLHHGDALVPRQQRFGQYTRSLMAKALGVPVINQFGLRPALVKGYYADLDPRSRINKDLDKLGLLNGRRDLQASIPICRTMR